MHVPIAAIPQPEAQGGVSRLSPCSAPELQPISRDRSSPVPPGQRGQHTHLCSALLFQLLNQSQNNTGSNSAKAATPLTSNIPSPNRIFPSTNRTILFLHFPAPECSMSLCFPSQPTLCWLLWLPVLQDVEPTSPKHPERSQQRGDRLCYQMPQSVCGALRECTNKARLKPLYSQYRLGKRAKVTKIRQPVLHEGGLLPTPQITQHSKEQAVESGFQALVFLLRSPGYHTLVGRWVHN